MSAGRLARLIEEKLKTAPSVYDVINHFAYDDALTVRMTGGEVYRIKIELPEDAAHRSASQ